MNNAGFSIELSSQQPVKNYGFSIEDNSNLRINLVDSITGDLIAHDVDFTVNIEGTDYNLEGDNAYGLKTTGGTVAITVPESTYYLAKSVAPFEHDGTEVVTVNVPLIMKYEYQVIPMLDDIPGGGSNIASLQLT